MKLTFADTAEADLERIADDLVLQSPFYALRLIRKLRLKAHELLRFPRAFQSLEGHSDEDIRRRVVESYLIVYRVEESEVTVLRVLPGASDWQRLLSRL